VTGPPPVEGAIGSGALGGEGTAPGDDSFDRLRRRVLWKMPSGLYLLGSRAGPRRNLMTLNWASQVALEPKLVGVSVEREALTQELISAGRVFAISILARADRAVVRRFVKPAEDDPDAGTLSGHPVRTDVTGAPILSAAVAWVDCEWRQTVECGSHRLFIGEVVGAGFGADEATEVLRMEDTRMNYGG
jgi:flavin reductase (DIM6/NTAB) family NADH-FMN oxidoreductase RutF